MAPRLPPSLRLPVGTLTEAERMAVEAWAREVLRCLEGVVTQLAQLDARLEELE